MVVLDASFLVAYHNRRDVHHLEATRVMERLVAGEWGTALLLEYVFLEVVTVLRLRRGLDAAVRVADLLLEAREVEFVPCSEVFLDALETFQRQQSGRLSFADAAVVAVARARADGLVATFDRGFQRLSGVSVVPDSFATR